MLITCKCLNVSIDLKGSPTDFPNVDISTLNLSLEEVSDSFFKEELKEVEIAEVTKQVKALVQTKVVGVWSVDHCLNCSTNCYSTCSNKATALVNASLFLHPDVIATMKTYKDYSPVFRIIIKPLVVEKNSNSGDSGQCSQEGNSALVSLQQQLCEVIREEGEKTDGRIRLYTEQQYNQLEEFCDRATKDHKALAQRIYEAQLGLKSEVVAPASVEGEGIAEPAGFATNKKVLSRRKTDSVGQETSQNSEPRSRFVPNRSGNLSARNSSSTSNSIDSEGLFVLEGMEDPVVNEPLHSEGDSDTDHDDSGSHDEGIDVHRKRTSSFHLAKSLPVNVPVYSIPNSDLDRNDESIDGVDIAASIKALARSVHGDAVFGDLPRPRFSTQI